MVKVLMGILHFFSETGTEGGYWAFQDSRFITKNTTRFTCTKCWAYLDTEADPDSPLQVTHVMPLDEALEEEESGKRRQDCPPDEHNFRPVSEDNWSHEGLHILKDEDVLIIYDKENPDQIVWQGYISLLKHALFAEHASGMWIHADQAGIDRETWANWFFEEYPAKLIKARPRDG
ncbi:MAG: hypothetical protein Q8P37_01590 [Candidatus Spechtbacteria bacterium]|nr:hypothetical protein [Candidatus Spechtbacteria bacterium]